MLNRTTPTITRRQALAGLAVPAIAASTGTAAALSNPDADLIALSDRFHALSAELARLYAIPRDPGEWEETPAEIAATTAQMAVADQVAAMVPATMAGLVAKLTVMAEERAGCDIPPSTLLRLVEEGHVLIGRTCPMLDRLRTEVAGDLRQGGVA
ncbi:hypothetical protein [Thalassobaculum litoreum]|uniref:Tat (Twin-arginine translocation) pathway signal sequence n=1 Tax=Thalassobaculum litoreum DSM 18839 TaxID=1123362 RepID=A0A8G2EWX5_9PROT|nr:hypothetical protein [Thalassobaculum litoreum]SDF15833.1 hypothetical protein SAMN05660686_00500 [Thalassobaculum litoreum DSM 18839]